MTPTLPGAPQQQRPRTSVLEVHGNPTCPPLRPAGAPVCLPGSSCAPSGLPGTPLAETPPSWRLFYGISVLGSLIDSLVARFLLISPCPIGCPFEDANSILLTCGWGGSKGTEFSERCEQTTLQRWNPCSKFTDHQTGGPQGGGPGSVQTLLTPLGLQLFLPKLLSDLGGEGWLLGVGGGGELNEGKPSRGEEPLGAVPPRPGG